MPEVERPEFRKDAKPTERLFKGKVLAIFDGCEDGKVRCNGMQSLRLGGRKVW